MSRITLKQWLALSPERRNRRRRHWQSDRGYWIGLLDEAHRRFKREFGQHPLVNDVRFTLRFGERDEPEIHVTTALWPPQLIEDLPDRYCTFRVTQQPNGSRKSRYLNCWTLLLGKLLRWSKSKVFRWARKHHHDVLNGIGPFADYYEPLDYITLLMIPASLRQRLPPLKERMLESRLKLAIQCWDFKNANYKYHPESPGYDWRATRARIRNILSVYESRR